MSREPSVVLGMIHHEDRVRSQSQREQAVQIVRELEELGFRTMDLEEFRQDLRSADELSLLTIWVLVFRRLWAQEIHHLREIRRRQGRRLAISFRKRRQAFARILSILFRRDSLLQSFRRLEIEAALSLKHLRIWRKVLDSKSIGAVVLEDDFFLRGDESAQKVADLIQKYSEDYDLIDLAGGLSRDSLGLPDTPGHDLRLPYMVANTTCAYFISSRACDALLKMVASRQELLYLAPDFLITELNARGFLGSSMLPFDLPLAHGSRDGTVESSIPY